MMSTSLSARHPGAASHATASENPPHTESGAPASILQWEATMREFEETDRHDPPPERAVLFIGSSSIRGWHTVDDDFPDHRVINRGFGGSRIADSVHYADRIVIPYRPAKIIFYAGENDLTAGTTPAGVAADFRRFVARVHAELPETEIAFISMKPSPSRRHLIEAEREGNRMIRGFTGDNEALSYIDVFEAMLDSDGEPRGELFVDDRLHMNERGYRLWTERVRPHMP